VAIVVAHVCVVGVSMHEEAVILPPMTRRNDSDSCCRWPPTNAVGAISPTGMVWKHYNAAPFIMENRIHMEVGIPCVVAHLQEAEAWIGACIRHVTTTSSLRVATRCHDAYWMCSHSTCSRYFAKCEAEDLLRKRETEAATTNRVRVGVVLGYDQSCKYHANIIF
jgi:hypothetical protein